MPEPNSVHVYKMKDGNTTIINVEQSDYFGVPCLKGIAIGPKSGTWAEGQTVYVPLANIQSVVVFPSREEYIAMTDRFGADKKGTH